MVLLLLLPLVTVLSAILAWRTRGPDRALSLAIVLLSLGGNVWYFSQFLAFDLA